MVAAATLPRGRLSLCLETDRKFSHWIKLSDTRPPSGGDSGTCQRILRWVRVMGATTIRSAGPSLNMSSDRTRAGRVPACSCPLTGSKFGLVIFVRGTQEALPAISLDSLVQNGVHRFTFLLGQPAEEFVRGRANSDVGTIGLHISEYHFVDKFAYKPACMTDPVNTQLQGNIKMIPF